MRFWNFWKSTRGPTLYPSFSHQLSDGDPRNTYISINELSAITPSHQSESSSESTTSIDPISIDQSTGTHSSTEGDLEWLSLIRLVAMIPPRIASHLPSIGGAFDTRELLWETPLGSGAQAIVKAVNRGLAALDPVHKRFITRNGIQLPASAVTMTHRTTVNRSMQAIFQEIAVLTYSAWHASSHNHYLVELLGFDPHYSANNFSTFLEHARDGTLRDYIKSRGYQSLDAEGAEEAMRFTYHVSSAVAYLHDNEILHNDIKLDNVLITRDGRGRRIAKLADFGHATFMYKFATDLVIGTPLHTAPELLDPDFDPSFDKKPSARSDIYSLGLLVFFIFEDFDAYCHFSKFHPELESHEMNDWLHNQIAGAIWPHFDNVFIGKGTVSLLRDIVQRSIDPNPQQRFQSVLDILGLLTSHWQDLR